MQAFGYFWRSSSYFSDIKESDNSSTEKQAFSKGLARILDNHDDSGNSSLMIASSHGNVEIAEILLKAGANVNVSNFSDHLSLHFPPQQIKLPMDANKINKRECIKHCSPSSQY